MSEGQRDNDKIIEVLRNSLQGLNGFFGGQKFSAEQVEMTIPAASLENPDTVAFAAALEKLQAEPQLENPRIKRKKRYLFT
jgi:hypothetical protein